MDWSFFIALRSEEQFDRLIEELTYLREVYKSIDQHEDSSNDHIMVKLKSLKFNDEDNDDMEITIEY